MKVTQTIKANLTYINECGTSSIGACWRFESEEEYNDFIAKAEPLGLKPLGEPVVNTIRFGDHVDISINQVVWMQGEDYFADTKRIDKLVGRE